MDIFFSYATTIIYVLLVLAWLYILLFYLRRFFPLKKTDKLLSLLLIILAIDAFRTLFESIYFGSRFSSLYGFLPIGVYDFLTLPYILFIPKIINLISAILVFTILINKWLSAEIIQKQQIKLKTDEQTKDLIQKNFELKEILNKAELSEKRFRLLFENNPVSLWEEDLSEVKELLDQREEKGDALKLYLDSNPDFVQECSSKVKIINLNQQTLNLLGVNTKEELINHLSQSFNKKSFETFKKELVALSNHQKSFSDETEFVKKDGSIIYVIIQFVAFEDFKSVIISINDISALKEYEQDMEIQNREFATLNSDYIEQNVKLLEAKDKAEESDQLKTEFINNMSHEIRTPMNGILGFLKFLNKKDLSELKRKHYTNIIQNSGKQLMNIIDDILEISQLGTTEVDVILEKTNLNKLFFELYSKFDAKARDKKISFYMNKTLNDVDSSIWVDEFKLKRILQKLIENALKFTFSGRIEFGYHIENTNLILYVKDTGIGIKPEHQNKIFDRFSQEEIGLSRSGGGLGLGLAISKEYVDLIGGSIKLESELDKGTNVIVTIPFKPVTLGENSDPEKTNNLILKMKEELKTVLIAEDDETNFLLLEALLIEDFGMELSILHAKNGREAVDLCYQYPDIDIALIDLKMPIMDGFEVAKSIKKMKRYFPLIAQTAYTADKEIEAAYTCGFDSVITKPLNKDFLLKILETYLV